MVKKITSRTQRLHEGAANTGERQWTRLSKDSEQEVLSLATKDYTVANVIRDLVDEALHVRHLNKAGRHPAVRELLRTFDEIINVRVSGANEPLARRLSQIESQSAQANRFLAALFITLTGKMELTTDTSDVEMEEALFAACAGEANLMTQLLVSPRVQQPPPPPPEATTPTLRDLVAQELISKKAQ